MSDELPPAGPVEKPERPKKLNRRQKRFADFYLMGLKGKGAECLRRMGENGTNEQLADRAYRLVNMPQVKAYMAERRKNEEEAYDINKGSVLRRLYLASSLEASVADLVDENGKAIPPKNLAPEIAALIVKMEVEEMYEGFSEDRKHVGTNYKYWMQEGNRAAEVLGRFLGWNKDKLDLGGVGTAPPVINISVYPDDEEVERAARAAVQRQPTSA